VGWKGAEIRTGSKKQFGEDMPEIRNILLTIAILFFITAVSGCEKDKIIKIGVAGPHSGYMAESGIPPKDAVMLAADNINEAGGILGKKIQIIAEDDVCKPEVAVNVASKLVSEEVIAVIGHVCDDSTTAAFEIYRKNGIPLVSPSAIKLELTRDNKAGLFFRTLPHSNAQANLLVRFISNYLHANRVAVVHDGGENSIQLTRLVSEGLKNEKISVILETGIEPGSDDYTPLIEEISRSNPDAVFFGGYYPEGAKMISQARKKNIKTSFISGEGLKDDLFIKSAGNFAEGYYVSSPADLSKVPTALQVNEKLKARGQQPGAFGLQAHAGFTAIINAVRITKSTKGEDIARTLRNSSISTTLGTISFDQYGDITGSGFSMYQVKNGVFNPVDW
jgi:branched-chain amino acid transport system substrate-binding protein